MKRSARGFTLIELLVSLSLAGILIAGAFQINTTFNSQSRRQNQLNEIQQSLRLSMQIIERSVRASGVGLTNGMMTLTPGCAGTRNFFHVQYYNNSTWPPPVNTVPSIGFDTSPNDFTTKPDMLRVITADSIGEFIATGDNGTSATLAGPLLTQPLLVGDWMLFVNGTSASTTTIGCLRQVSNLAAGITTSAPSYVSGTVPHGTAPALACANLNTTCTSAGPFPAPVRIFRGGAAGRSQTFFRIIPGSTVTDSPKLALFSMTLGDPPVNATWSVIADDIEDMQIALLLASGKVCNDVDDPTPAALGGVCDPSTATAIRITLVARTPGIVPGSPASQTGGYEDNQPAVPDTTGYLRRALTTEILLRN